MHKTMEATNKLCSLKEKLIPMLECELSKPMEAIHTEELGEVVDMVKDFCEAEKDLWKACYYKSVVEAMEEYGDEEQDYPNEARDRYGYDHWRYSSGRYAPKGRGHYSRKGYYPTWPDDMLAYPDDMYPSMRDGKLGYTDPDMREMASDTRHGQPYKDWKMSKRHYTETKSDSDRKEMSTHAKEHMADTVMTVKEMWADADPELRDKMKRDVTALLNEMK